MTRRPDNLDQLRAEIDRIDEALHDLIVERTALAGRIAEAKKADGETDCYLRPGREAKVLRRLTERHTGAFPKATLIRVWRELMGANTRLQGSFSVAVFQPMRGAGFLEMARDQYGAYAVTRPFATPSQVIQAVTTGEMTVGILPVPDGQGAAESADWWARILGEDAPRVIARLPFAGPGTGRGDGLEALVIGRQMPDPTGDDRALIAVETDGHVSRARLRERLEASGIDTATTLAEGTLGPGVSVYLMEIEGLPEADDPHLARLAEAEGVGHVNRLGGYALPLTDDQLR